MQKRAPKTKKNNLENEAGSDHSSPNIGFFGFFGFYAGFITLFNLSSLVLLVLLVFHYTYCKNNVNQAFLQQV